MSWQRVSIDSIKSAEPYSLVGGPFGSNLTTRDYVEDGIPVIRGANLPEDQTFLDTDFVFVREEKADSLAANTAYPGDIVFTQRGTLGQVGLIPREAKFARYIISQSQMKLTVDEAQANPWFVYYFFRHPGTVQTIKNHALTSGVPHINLGILKSFQMPLPPLTVQNSVVAILSAYDDLIENNRRRMALLEEAARHLYREWFVRLRFPGHEHTRIIDGVPEGWERRSLSDLAEFRLGKMLDARKNRGERRPYLANINVRWGEIDLRDLREMPFEEHELDKYGLRYGDIVMCEGGEPGRCAIWKDQSPGMMFQKAIHRIRVAESFDHHFLYYSLYYKGISGQLSGLFTGATIKHLPREKLAKITLDVPPRRLIDLFSEQVGPIEQQIGILQAATRRASEARDLLLPRLMSGEIAV